MANNKLLEISPTNIIVQIIPDFLKTNNDQMNHSITRRSDI